MTQRFKRKTLAVSIAAALFGGMALAVAPIMTPVALANQFEASSLGTVTSKNLYTGVPKDILEAKTGSIVIQELGEWEDGKFIVTFPGDTKFWDLVQNKMVDDPTAPGALADSFWPDDFNGVKKVVFSSARYNSANQLEVTFSAEMVASSNPRSFRFTAYLSSSTVGDFRVKIADDPNDRVGLDTLAGQPDNGIKIAKFFDTSALVTAAAATSVDIGLTNQPVANVTTELLVQTPSDARILLTLDQGAWVSDIETKVRNAGLPMYMGITRLSDTQLELVRNNGRWNANDQLALSGLQINAVNVPADTDINVTVTSQGAGTDVAIPNFGEHKVKVARTKGAAGKDVTVGLTTDPTTDVLYVGRHEQTVTNVVKLAEAMPATLTPNGTLNYTLSTGVFNPTSTLTFGGTTPLPTCAPIGATASAKFECAAGTSVTGTAGAWTLPPRQAGTYSGPFNMYNATVGDLNVTIDGTAWSNWTSNVVKLADVKKATTSTLDGSVDTLRLGSSGTVKMTLPDIVIQENNAGALVAGPFVVAIDEGLNLNVLPTTEVKVFNKDGAEVNVQLSQIRSPTLLISATNNPNRGIDITWPGLPAANGPYKIVISGVQVEADSSTSPGDYNLSVASTLLDGDIRPIDYRSDINSTTGVRVAGVYFETFPAVKVIDNLTTTAWVDASGPIDDLSAYANILPGIEARGKSGSYYLMLQMPPQFTGDWSLWTLGPTGWTMVTPSDDVRKLCSTMTSYQGGTLDDVTNLPLVVDTNMTVYKDVMVWMGYGVGATLFHPEAPCLNMLENSTYWYVYTVK